MEEFEILDALSGRRMSRRKMRGMIMKTNPNLSSQEVNQLTHIMRKGANQRGGGTGINTKTRSRSDLILAKSGHKLPQALQTHFKRANANDRKVNSEEKEFYKLLALTSLNGNIWDATSKKVTGLCNLNENQFESRQHFSLTGLKLVYGFDATADDVVNIGMTNANIPPPQLANSLLVLENDGETKLLEIPIRDLFKMEGGKSVSLEDRYDTYFLPEAELFSDANRFTWKIVSADGATLPSGNHFLGLTMVGHLFREV